MLALNTFRFGSLSRVKIALGFRTFQTILQHFSCKFVPIVEIRGARRHIGLRSMNRQGVFRVRLLTGPAAKQRELYSVNRQHYNLFFCHKELTLFLFLLCGRHFSSDTSKTFMHGNIDCMEQPEEYHKMAVPGT